MNDLESKIEAHMNNRPPEEMGKAPGPGSIMWDTFSDSTIAPFAVPILLMQAAHPDIGAAVASYSILKKDPWGRLVRTASSLMRFLYGGKNGEQSRREAMDLRKLHSHLKGTRPDGEKYFAINARSYRIVPDTFLDAVIRIRDVLGKPLSETEKKKLYEEYVDLCMLFGIRRKEIEPDFESFQAYYDDILLNVMNYNETIKFLLEDMIQNGPNVKNLPIPQKMWDVAYQKMAYPVLRTFTYGFLDKRFREKHGLRWSVKDQVRYEKYCKWVRTYAKVVPRPLRYNPFALWIMAGGEGVKMISLERLEKIVARRKAQELEPVKPEVKQTELQHH